MKKILFGLAAFALVIATVPMFAAFEAHVINVTATIENALQVTPSEISFGTTFPQERLDKTFEVSLSGSFKEAGRVDDVSYIIRQKPKCVLVTQGITLPQYGLVTEVGGRFVCADEVNYDILPLLCPYLSKHEITTDDPNGGNNDSAGINAFHGLPGEWNLATTLATQVAGKLMKSTGDTSDTWNIDLKVPCFKGSCAQDWAAFVHEQNPQADPVEYMADPLLEHKLFGCDLWLEVNGVSVAQQSEGPTVGAALASYVAPTVCDFTVDDSFTVDTAITSNTIQEGVNAAVAGQTVCVKAGSYTEDVNVNKSITLAGDGPTLVTLTGVGTGEAGALVVSADNVTVKGFKVIGTGVSAIRISGARNLDTISFNDAVAATGQNAFLTDGGQSNHTVNNNVFSGASSQLVYVNGLASVNVASTNVDFTQNSFEGSGNQALGQEAGASSITLNKFSTVTSFTDVEDWEGGNNYNQNNFNDAGLNLVHSENGFTGDNGITDAQNNWWGDIDPSDGDVSANVDVDFIPFELAAFPQN